MPIYEYRCPECGLKFELLRPMSRRDESAPCPNCNNGAGRVPSTFASFAKGSDGTTTPLAGMPSCGTCAATSCSTCH